jgi:uncharacterized protein YdhG (YjbR/CyaY superfamily)
MHYHKDGTLWAKGTRVNGVLTGYWEWFRKDGTKMRSGSFENGRQVGEWTTFDSKARVVKVTQMKEKSAAATVRAHKASASSRTKAGSRTKASVETRSIGKREPASKSSASVIGAYLAKLPVDQRAALEKLRKMIRAAAPGAEECLSYQLPAFRLDGKVLVCFGASSRHCSFHPGSGTAVAAHAKELASLDTSKGTIRFTPDKPLSSALVRKIVKYRIAENACER